MKQFYAFHVVVQFPETMMLFRIKFTLRAEKWEDFCSWGETCTGWRTERLRRKWDVPRPSVLRVDFSSLDWWAKAEDGRPLAALPDLNGFWWSDGRRHVCGLIIQRSSVNLSLLRSRTAACLVPLQFPESYLFNFSFTCRFPTPPHHS